MSEGLEGVLTFPKVESARRIDVSGDDLVRMFSGAQFRNNIIQMSSRTRRSDGVEQGSSIYRNLENGELTFVDAQRVGYMQTNVSQKESERRSKLLQSGNSYLMDIHTHPLMMGRIHEAASYCPSPEDLTQLDTDREVMKRDLNVDSSPLGVIVIVNGKDKVDMIIYQANERTPTAKSPFLLKQYERDIQTCVTVSDALQLLRDYGYKAEFITYNLKKGAPALSPTGQAKIETFGYNVVYQPEEDDMEEDNNIKQFTPKAAPYFQTKAA